MAEALSVNEGEFTEPAVHKEEIVKSLVQEYLSARQEVLLHVQLYKTQERNGAIVVALLGILFPLAIGQDVTLWGNTIHLTPLIDLAILFIISSIAFVMFFSGIAVLFSLQVLAERCFHLENEINKLLGATFFFWERFAHEIWSSRSSLVSKMPDAVTMVLFYFLVGILAVVVPIIVSEKILCGSPSPPLMIIVAGYLYYLILMPSLAVHMNHYTMGPLRSDCRRLLEHSLGGKDMPRQRSGWPILLTIALGVAAANYVLVWILPGQRSWCEYIGSIK
jgi:hypothetical protein